MQLPWNEKTVGLIELTKVGTMSGIVCSPFGEVFISQGPIIWLLDRSDMSLTRYAGQSRSSDGKEGHRLENASFRRARGMSYTDMGFYVVDTDDSRVCKIEDDYVSHFAGKGEAGFADGPRKTCQFRHPCSIVAFQDVLIVSDTGNQKIRFIDPDGMVTSIGTITGNANGSFDVATFTNPCMLCVTPRDTVLVTDGAMHLLREIDMTKKTVWTLEPKVPISSTESSLNELSIPQKPQHNVKRSKKPGDQVFQCPLGMVFDQHGFLYLANYSDHAILKIDYDKLQVTTFFGGEAGRENGLVENATTKWPNYICLTPEGDMFWTEHMDSSIRYILGAVPPFTNKSQDTFPSFFSIFETCRNADIHISLHGSNETINLHSFILAASCDKTSLDINVIESSKVTIDDLRHFISILYGEKQFHETSSLEQACSYTHAHYLAYNIGLSDEWKEYFDLKFLNSISSFGLPLLMSLLKIIGNTYPIDDRRLQIICAWIRSRRDDGSKEIAKKEFNNSSLPAYLEMALGTTEIPVKLNTILQTTTSPLDLSLRRHAEMLDWVNDDHSFKHGPPDSPSNFLIKDGCGKAIAVHDWILYTRWPFFKSLMDSGLAESSAGSMELSSSTFPSSTLLQFLKYLYYGIIVNESREMVIFKEDNDCEWIMENGAQFNVFVDVIEQTVASPGFEKLINHCKQCVKRLKSTEQEDPIEIIESEI
jgi:hypothetical protein